MNSAITRRVRRRSRLRIFDEVCLLAIGLFPLESGTPLLSLATVAEL